jgi:hypothetical protein
VGKTFDGIDGRLRDFLLTQPLFFVATAPSGRTGHLNLSPKGVAGTFAVVDAHTVAYLDLTGSGVETIAHLKDNGRIVVMFCAFDGPPRIVRLHGQGEAVTAGDERFADLVGHFPMEPPAGLRSVIRIQVTRISDSCGFGVPVMRLESERPLLQQWAARKGPDGLAEYRATNNATSIDGLPGMN